MEDNIEKHFREIGCEAVEWIELNQLRIQWRVVVNKVMSLQVPKICGILLAD
jgi:hypothetical protein